MRCMVTGASGFVGSFLVRRLLAENHTVAILVRSSSDLWRLGGITDRLTFITGDLRNGVALMPQLESFQPEVLFHFAWDGTDRASRNSPIQISNIGSTLDLLAYSRQAGCRVFLGIGSQAEYGLCDQRLREEHRPQPVEAYGVAKYCLSQLTATYCELVGMRSVWPRIFSVYGPADHPQNMLPLLITQLLAGVRPRLTAAEQLWDYLYIDDAVEAIYRSAVTSGSQGLMNLASGSAIPLRTIIEKTRDLIDPSLPLGFGEVPYSPKQVMHLEGDVSRLSSTTGWTPRVSLEDGLRKTIQWYRTQSSAL